MALLPYIMLKPVGAMSLLVVDSPHSGRIYPADFTYTCPLPLLRQVEDAYMDEVVAGAVAAGASVVVAEFPRSMIDVNRAEDDIDPAVIDGLWPEALSPSGLTLSGFGLVRRLCRQGVPLYGAPLSVTEVQRRVDVYYRPYHACLRRQIDERMEKIGQCFLINAHSMPDRVDNGVSRPDFVLGNRDGACCAPSVMAVARELLTGMGYSVAVNDPYKGREIVQRYGKAGTAVQALQVEVNRRLYLDEQRVEKHLGFTLLRDNMTRFFEEFVEAISVKDADRLVAE